MLDRSQVITQNILQFLTEKRDPAVKYDSGGLAATTIVDIFESQLSSRLLDLKARKLKTEEKSFYTIGSSGHESMAIIGEVSRLTDMAFLHYRDAALQIQRSKKQHGHTPLYDLLLSFCASSQDPISGGRHKVLGHKKLFIPPQTSTIASHLPKAVGAALSIHKAQKLGIKNPVLNVESVIVCTFGDASLNHASSQTALNCAEWIAYQQLPLPIVFICEDNGIGISVKTPPEWVSSCRSQSKNIQYFSCDGSNLVQTYLISQQAFQYTRTTKKPSFLHIKTVRLMGHAGSDVEQVYRNSKELDEEEKKDPLLHTMYLLTHQKILPHEQILDLYKKLDLQIDRVASYVLTTSKIKNAEEVMQSLVPQKKIREDLSEYSADHQQQRQQLFGQEWKNISAPQSLAKNINWALTDLLHQYPQAALFGEDVATKGGVYNVTANLEKRFGKNRVFNSLLDETNILGTAIGLAHNGILPVPEIQFLAYVHNAEDQIRGEASTLSFFSNTQYTNGMVIRIAGLAYQKGFGGHFHNDNSIAIFRDIPSVILACPSHGEDAAKMLRECFYQAYYYGRVCVFLEPIALYQTRDLLKMGDNLWAKTYPLDTNEKIALGDFAIHVGETDLCIVTYGNGFYMSMQAKEELQAHHIKPTIIDLRWLTDFNRSNLFKELQKYNKILIVDECRQKGSLSEEIMSLCMETLNPLPSIKRLCSKDCFIPLGAASNLVLIQKEDIINAILEWKEPSKVGA